MSNDSIPAPRGQGGDVKSCTRCGGTDLYVVECGVGPHHSRTYCRPCQIPLWYNPAPWTLERARAFVMPIGQFKGFDLATLASNPRGLSYLRWGAENLKGNAGKAAKIVVEYAERAKGGVR